MAEGNSVPVEWKTSQAVADRLLGKAGRPVLEQNIQLAQEAAARRKWPLKRIQLEHRQDAEDADWQVVQIVLVFDTTPAQAQKLFTQFLRTEVQQYADSLRGKRARDIFVRRISHDFESR